MRAIAPEVGGGFGSKLQIYGEEIFCAWAARKLGRPVKWVATRSDDMATMHHGRDQVAYVEAWAPSATARSPPSTRRSSPTSAPTTCC